MALSLSMTWQTQSTPTLTQTYPKSCLICSKYVYSVQNISHSLEPDLFVSFFTATVLLPNSPETNNCVNCPVVVPGTFPFFACVHQGRVAGPCAYFTPLTRFPPGFPKQPWPHCRPERSFRLASRCPLRDIFLCNYKSQWSRFFCCDLINLIIRSTLPTIK